MSEKLLPVKEVARRLGVTPRQVQRLAGAGKFPHAVKVGWAWVIPERDVTVELKRRERQVSAPD